MQKISKRDAPRRLMNTPAPWLLLLAGLAWTAACGDGGGGDGGATAEPNKNDVVEDTGGIDEDTAVEQDAGSTDEPDAGAQDSGSTDEPDTGAPDIEGPDIAVDNCPGGAYCPCSKASECNSSFCMDSPDGKYCAPTCIDACEKPGFTCLSVSGIGPDGSAVICVPSGGANLCNPCSQNSDCKAPGYSDALCVKYGSDGDQGAFCGTGCTSDDECPVDYVCGDAVDVTGKKVKQCVVAPGKGACKCSKYAMEIELSTTCYKTSGDTKCKGTRTCLAAGKQGAPDGGGLSICTAADKSNEVCDGVDNDCDGDVDEATCDDGGDCKTGTCSKDTLQCEYSNKTGQCDADGDVCTENDQCENGKCKAGAVKKCDDNNPCTDDKCDPKDGCKYEPNTAPCNADDNGCTVNDVCKEGKCAPGEKKACASDDPCVTGKCKITDGKCAYKFEAGLACNDNKLCTTKDKCIDDKTGCKGEALNCDDGESCTADSCDPAKGCVNTPTPGACNDGDECTAKDACDQGKCVGTGAKDCDDNDACTKDGCDKIKGCLHAPISNDPCDDGNACTKGDVCEQGKCKPGVNQCTCLSNADCKKEEDGNLCNGTLYCDKSTQPFSCKVLKSTVVTCDTSKDTFCAETKCDPVDGKCKVVKKSKGTPCNADQSVCTKDDFCDDSGVCKPGDKLVCDDNNVCTNDNCDPLTGCKFPNNSAPCDADKDACTQNDKCIMGKCVAGPLKSCDDGEVCTKNTCDKTTGACKTQNLPGACDDKNVCTKGDQCGTDPKTKKYTCIGGAPDKCDDNNLCTKDACVLGKGCVNTADDTLFKPCYSGDPKTKGEGICKAGKLMCSGGKLGSKCVGEVLPEAKENCKDKLDNNCNGQVNEGCAPTGYTARFGTAVIDAKGSKYAARALVGGSTAAGQSVGQKTTVSFGFYSWVKALLKQ